MIDEIFRTRAVPVSLPLFEERRLIEAVQAGDGESSWPLLLQYRGLLQKTVWTVRKSTRLTSEQQEDLEADLVLATIEAIKTFDLERFTRLSQVLPGRLRDIAMEVTAQLTIPRGTLALWFKIWRASEQDFDQGAKLAPTMGMAAGTFRAITQALTHAGSEWVNVPYTAGVPTADQETYSLAQAALATLSPAEREVIELVYGFRGDPKTDEETSLILDSTKGTVKTQRKRALVKMRTALTE